MGLSPMYNASMGEGEYLDLLHNCLFHMEGFATECCKKEMGVLK